MIGVPSNPPPRPFTPGTHHTVTLGVPGEPGSDTLTNKES